MHRNPFQAGNSRDSAREFPPLMVALSATPADDASVPVLVSAYASAWSSGLEAAAGSWPSLSPLP